MHTALQNLFKQVPISFTGFMTLVGVEYELRWITAALANGTSAYVRITTSAEKYTVLGSRFLKMDQERGFYRAHSAFTGGIAGAAIPVSPLRLDTAVPVQGVAVLFPGATPTPANLVVEVPLFGVAGQGNQPAEGADAVTSALRVLPPGSVVLLEFENASIAASYVQVSLKFWEISADLMPESEDI